MFRSAFLSRLFQNGKLFGKPQGEQSWTVDNRRLVVIVYKGYFDGLDSDVDGNVLKKHNTHTHISTFWGFRGAVCIVLVLRINFYSYYWRVTVWSLTYVFELVIQQPLYGCFQKWWYPTTMGFPTKNDHFGVSWRYHHLRKRPYKWVSEMSPLQCDWGTMTMIRIVFVVFHLSFVAWSI